MRAISKIKNIWIAINNRTRKTWEIIKHEIDKKPERIAFISYYDTNNDLSCHYDAIKFRNVKTEERIKKESQILLEKSNENKKGNTFKILIWNAKSLYQHVKKLFLIDILRNENPEIVIVSETFLLDDDSLYIEGFKTYKTRNVKRRKGFCILISKNILAIIITFKNSIEDRRKIYPVKFKV